MEKSIRKRNIVLLPETAACSQTAIKVQYIGNIHSVVVAQWSMDFDKPINIQISAKKVPFFVRSEKKLREFVRNINPAWVK